MSTVTRPVLYYVNDSVAHLRGAPTHESKMASQAIFSELITVERLKDDWAFIRTSDQYPGFVPVTSFVARHEPYEMSLKVTRIAGAHLYRIKDTEYGPFKTLPYGARLQDLDSATQQWIQITVQDGAEVRQEWKRVDLKNVSQRWIQVKLPDEKVCYIQSGDVLPEPELHCKGDLVEVSKRFIGVGYYYGGRSSFGFDCSGFVQMLYSRIGILLPRDSKDQAVDDRFQTVPIEQAQPGDLIFFGNSSGRISHVGMYLGEGRFIHSTVGECKPWLRISHLSDFEWNGNARASKPYRLVRQLRI